MDPLAAILRDIQRNDTNYAVRERLVWQALAAARRIGLSAGVRFDPQEPEWPVVYIELPTGQVSWHMPQHAREWDGHSTRLKYERIERFCQQCPTTPSARNSAGA